MLGMERTRRKTTVSIRDRACGSPTSKGRVSRTSRDSPCTFHLNLTNQAIEATITVGGEKKVDQRKHCKRVHHQREVRPKSGGTSRTATRRTRTTKGPKQARVEICRKSTKGSRQTLAPRFDTRPLDQSLRFYESVCLEELVDEIRRGRDGCLRWWQRGVSGGT
jgi:hypothetical protein